MRKIWSLLLALASSIFLYGQIPSRDSLRNVVEKEPTHSLKVNHLVRLSHFYLTDKPFVGIQYAEEGLEMARSLNYQSGESACLNALGNCYRMIGNFTESLNYHLQALKIAEQIGDSINIALSYHGLAADYEDQEDYGEALVYSYKDKAVAEQIHFTADLTRITSNMGHIYEKLGKLDSALKYEQQSAELCLSSEGVIKGIVMARLGNIYEKLGNEDLAQSFYRNGITQATSDLDYNALHELLNSSAKLFLKQNKTDSSILLAQRDLKFSQALSNPGDIIEAATLLNAIYKDHDHIDSAYKYLAIATAIKDTLITQNKLKQQQTMAFEESLRQKQIASDLATASEQRRRNLQYTAIAIGIISFTILFLLLSLSIIVNTRMISVAGLVGLMIIFEFVNLWLHPYMSHFTHDAPLLMLLIMVCIAGSLAPIHHRLEHWITTRLVEKNRKIRLASAKKTIEELEKEAKR